MALALDSLDPPIQVDEKGSRFVVIQGRYQGPQATLIHDLVRVPLLPDGASRDRWKFEIRVPVTSQSTPVHLKLIDAFGRLREDRMVIEMPASALKLAEGARRRQGSSYISLGLSRISYSEHEEGFREAALTLKGGHTLRRGRFEAGLAGYGTLMPLAGRPAGESIRFVGLNLRAGLADLDWLPAGWRLSLLGGGFYTTTFSKPRGEFGFKSMSGPQLSPVFSRTFAGGQALSIHFKYSPIAQRFLSFDGRELAAGATLAFPNANGPGYLLSVDISDLNLRIQRLLPIRSRSLSLGFGLSW